MITTDFNKEYLKYSKEQATKWHFYLGGDPSVETTGVSGPFDWGRDVNFLYKIRQSDVNFVTDRVDWKSKIKASPWLSSGNFENSLIFNPINNIAYLCVSDNPENRSDTFIRGKKSSTYIPSHSTGLQDYPDGYSWFALFVVDPMKQDLITTKKIPVMSLDDYNTEITNTSLTQKYSQICGADYNSSGACCLYVKEKSKDGLGNVFNVGDLSYVKLVSTCYRCAELAKLLNCEYRFKGGHTTVSAYPTCSPCDCSIEIKNKIDEIAGNATSLNPGGFFSHIYSNYENWQDTSEILSIFINLENLTEEELSVNEPNPQVIFRTITGTNASAQLLTDSLGDGTFRVKGIQLLSRGKNYKIGDANPLIVGYENSVLNSRIEVNGTPEDFPENPVSMLNNIETCIKVSITNQMIESTNTNIRNFTKYGIIKDVKLQDGETNASDGLNVNEYQVLRATSLVNLSKTQAPVLD